MIILFCLSKSSLALASVKNSGLKLIFNFLNILLNFSVVPCDRDWETENIEEMFKKVFPMAKIVTIPSKEGEMVKYTINYMG